MEEGKDAKRGQDKVQGRGRVEGAGDYLNKPRLEIDRAADDEAADEVRVGAWGVVFLCSRGAWVGFSV